MQSYYVAMPNGDIAGKIIILMILVFVEIKRLTVNYLSELSNFLSLYLIIKYFSLCRNIFKET